MARRMRARPPGDHEGPVRMIYRWELGILADFVAQFD
jgi:hypothetical protein